MISKLLQKYAELVLDRGDPKPKILVFTSTEGDNLALGNLVWMFPMFKALERLYPIIVCGNSELRQLIQYNIGCETYSFDALPDYCYSTSINNFLCQTTRFVRKIISLRIPCRIGHDWPENQKYTWLFTHTEKICPNTQEELANNRLLNPLGLLRKRFVLDAPPIDRVVASYDILIQPYSWGDSTKNWQGYADVIRSLSCKVGIIGNQQEKEYCDRFNADNLCGKYSIIEMCHLLKQARIVVGNDGGMVKLANALGVRTVQIFAHPASYLRARTRDINLVNPNYTQVVDVIRHYAGS